MIQVTWSGRDHIALAVSGGVDSMVLLHLLLTEYKDTYQSLTLLHVNHGLRLESNDEAAYITSYAKAHDVALFTTYLKLSPEDFTQETARQARYRFFYDMMNQHKVKHLLTAHHKDDDLETLMNQVLSARPPLGIAEHYTDGCMTLHRPLLRETKANIYRYALKENVTFFEDASNQQNDYTRNYIRNAVLPVINKHPHMSAIGLLQLKSDYADFMTICEEKFKFVDDEIARETFNRLTAFEQAFVLRKLSGDISLSQAYITEIANVIASHTANACFQTAACDLHIAYHTVTAKRHSEAVSHMEIVAAGEYIFNNYTIHVHEETVPLRVRTFKPGDKMRLDFGTKKVSRMFIDEKIPKHLRNHVPIVENQSGEIIAVGTMYNIIDRKLLNIERIASHDTEK